MWLTVALQKTAFALSPPAVVPPWLDDRASDRIYPSDLRKALDVMGYVLLGFVSLKYDTVRIHKKFTD